MAAPTNNSNNNTATSSTHVFHIKNMKLAESVAWFNSLIGMAVPGRPGWTVARLLDIEYLHERTTYDANIDADYDLVALAEIVPSTSASS